MIIEPGKKYRIKGNSKVLKDKYGTANPVITIEDEFSKLFGVDTPYDSSLRNRIGVYVFTLRAVQDKLPFRGLHYYGHVKELGEIVHESELEEIK